MYNNINILGFGYTHINDRSNTTPIRPFWRIYWNPIPGGFVEDNDRKYYLDKSKIIAIPPGLSIKQGMYREFESLHIHVDCGRILGSYNELLIIPASGKLLEQLEFILSTLEESKKGRNGQSIDPYLEICFYYVIYAVLTDLKREYIELLKPDDERITKCIDKMVDSLRSGIENAELARIAGMSTNSFIRFFKGETGKTPQAYFLSLRLEESTILLICTDKTIDEISEECGFCERSYFSRMFKREYEMGPAEYRKFSCVF